ncbi:hypothetical protein [Streptomyces sp. NPDC018045]|uniref:hypothetical protein n=1 Tax=Streptomyces sp. NPDC018045 TaxID=3365037 RepID=UPI0037B1FEE0
MPAEEFTKKGGAAGVAYVRVEPEEPDGIAPAGPRRRPGQYERATGAGVQGRSSMARAALVQALSGDGSDGGRRSAKPS